MRRKTGAEIPLAVRATKQDPGVQEGESGCAQCAGDAIADPMTKFTLRLAYLLARLRHAWSFPTQKHPDCIKNAFGARRLIFQRASVLVRDAVCLNETSVLQQQELSLLTACLLSALWSRRYIAMTAFRAAPPR